MSEVARPKVRNAFNRERVKTMPEGKSRTNQSMSKDADINNIMKRYEKTGLIEHTNQYQGDYGDFTQAMEYHEALNFVRASQEMFMTLPAPIRAEFDNDAGRFLSFVNDPKNAEAMIEMGLATRRTDGQGEGASGGSPETPPETPSEDRPSTPPGEDATGGGPTAPTA